MYTALVAETPHDITNIAYLNILEELFINGVSLDDYITTVAPIFTGNTLSTCISDLYVHNLAGCPLLNVTTDMFVNGSTNITGNLTVLGDAILMGSGTTFHTENFTVEDNIITLNSSFTAGTPFLDAGIEVMRGDEVPAQIIWNEDNDEWTIGYSGDMHTIITSETLSGTTNYIPKFTDSHKLGNSLIYDNGIDLTMNGNVKIPSSYYISTTNVVDPTGVGPYITLSSTQLAINSRLNNRIALDVQGVASQSADIFRVSNIAGGAGNYFVVKSDGKTGIGTTNPFYKLDVNGTGRFNDMLQLSGSSGINLTSSVALNNGIVLYQTEDQVSNYGRGKIWMDNDRQSIGEMIFRISVGAAGIYSKKWISIGGDGASWSDPASRIDLNAGQIFLQGPVYLSGGITLPRLGDATSTATQKGTRNLGFQNSLWNGTNAVLIDSYVSSKASTTENLKTRLAFDIQDESGSSTRIERMCITSGGYIGIGTTAPNQQLEITKNFRLPSTTYNSGSTYGVIYKDGTPFIHNFNYGWNGITTTNGSNTFIGFNAGNLTMGSTATANHEASANSAVGHGSLLANTTGYYNSSLGTNALRYNTTGNSNTAIGAYSQYLNTTGNGNASFGYASLQTNTTGNNNSAFGMTALFSNTTGNNNSAFGKKSLYANTTGYNNSAVGTDSLRYNTTGYYNLAVGYGSLYLNTTGNNNSGIGVVSLQNNTTGNNNSAIGYNSGAYITDGITPNTAPNNSVYLGVGTKASFSANTNEIVIGYDATGLGSNTVVLGNPSITTTRLQGNVGIGTDAPDGKLSVVGNITVTGNTIIDGDLIASTKSFVIPHPIKEGKKLHYGSLEGPEHGVYVRGKLNNTNIIELPEYWTKLVDEDSITVNLTPYNHYQKLYVKSIKDNKIYIGNNNWFNKKICCDYTVYATRAIINVEE